MVRYAFSIYLDILPKKLQLQDLVPRLVGWLGSSEHPLFLRAGFNSQHSQGGSQLCVTLVQGTQSRHTWYTHTQVKHLDISKRKKKSGNKDIQLQFEGSGLPSWCVVGWGLVNLGQPGFSSASASHVLEVQACGALSLVLLNLVMVVIHRGMAAGLVFQKAFSKQK